MTSVSKNDDVDKLDDIVEKYNNIYYSAIKMKPADAKTNTYIDSSKEINDKDCKFNIGGTVRISKYKSICAKGYTPNLSEEVFVIKKVKEILRRGHMLLMILMEEKRLYHSTKNNCKNKFKKSLELNKQSIVKVTNYMGRMQSFI